MGLAISSYEWIAAATLVIVAVFFIPIYLKNHISTMPQFLAQRYRRDDHDRAMRPWVNKFNPYDLYSKSPKPPVVSELKSYYEDLIAKYLPATVRL